MADAPKKKGLTLYQDLLSAETLAEMQARDAKAQADKAKKEKDASLMFTPTNLGKKNSKPAPKPKPSFATVHKHSSSTATTAPSVGSPEVSATPQLSSTPQAQAAQKRGFNDWLADEDQEQEYYERPRYPQSSHKKKKKKKEIQEQWSFDEPYDPSVPVPFQKYPGSADWKALKDAWRERLWTARDGHMKRQDKGSSRNPTNQFAPPSMFAPPADYSQGPSSRPRSRDSGPGINSGFGNGTRAEQPPSFAPPDESMKDGSGEDASARRLAMYGQQNAPVPGQALQTSQAPSKPLSEDVKAKQAAAQAKIAAIIKANSASKTASSASPVQNKPSDPPAVNTSEGVEPPFSNTYTSTSSEPAGVISAAPTFNPEYYSQRSGREAIPDAGSAVEAPANPDAPRSKAPGQADFAERMMRRMGWEEGKGLGAHGEGIQTAISVKAEKRKKKPDAAGGGYVTPANMGQIIGGKRQKAADADNGPHGKMSKVIKFEGMLRGMDVDKEIADKGILQEIGDQMGDFGQVERIYIWRDHDGGNDDVFVKYTSEASAHKAIKALDGAEFEGNNLVPKYWDEEKFDEGEFT